MLIFYIDGLKVKRYLIEFQKSITGNDVYSGDRFSGNDWFNEPITPDDTILFTVSRITVIANNIFWDFNKKLEFLMQMYDYVFVKAIDAELSKSRVIWLEIISINFYQNVWQPF